MVVNADMLGKLARHGDGSALPPANTATPDNIAYVLFTSGTTGVPKGLIMEHRSICTAITALSKRQGITPGNRMLQFSAYVFDVSIGEMFWTILNGSTVCTPSDYSRVNSLQDYIIENKINWLSLTPTFARTLQPEAMPDVNTVCLGGEAMPKDIVTVWFPYVRLLNLWGPAETCIWSSIYEYTSIDDSAATIGRAVGGHIWLVDPDDHTKLAPYGVPGEIVVQGPTIMREYLNEPEKTADAILHTLPSWTTKHGPQWGRMYKSGDLAFYNSKGRLEFSSRKDTQVKIRGLRIELGEIEHHITQNLDTARQVYVDVIDDQRGVNLIAYICYSEDRRTRIDDVLFITDPSQEMQADLSVTLGKLVSLVPQYMLPTYFVPCNYIPVSSAGKVDRKTLKSQAENITEEHWQVYSLTTGEKAAVETEMEKKVQSLWAQAMQIDAASIGRDDSFLRIGGDSITAIKFVAAARDDGLAISVKDVFDDPRLRVVAQKCSLINDADAAELVPFQLIDGHVSRASIEQAVGSLPSGMSIGDAYPATPLQEGLLALSTKQPGSYIAKYVFKLAEGIDLDHFKASWNKTVDLCANLRTRIVVVNNKAMQVEIKNDATWEDTSNDDVQSFIKGRIIQMTHGSRLNRFALVKDNKDSTYFCWITHHSVFDGWTIGVVMNAFLSIFHNDITPTLQPYSRFIEYVVKIEKEKAIEFWKRQLEKSTKATFPTKPKATQFAKSSKVAHHRIDVPRSSTTTSITKATVLRATWAIVLSRYCESDDVTFGTSISGRQAAVDGAIDMPGPMVATVPVRVKLEQTKTVAQLLEQLQNQATEMIPYEQFGLQNISKIDPDMADACDFTSLLVVQPYQKMYDDTDKDSIWTAPDEDLGIMESMQDYFSYPLVVQGIVADESIDMSLTYDVAILGGEKITALCEQFSHVVRELMTEAAQGKRISDISVAGQWDIQRANAYQGEVGDIVNVTYHDAIAKQARETPDKIAIDAWDGKMTYHEYDEAANRLAQYIIGTYGITKGDIVHLCFEKSLWHFVAMLAVNKAGAA